MSRIARPRERYGFESTPTGSRSGLVLPYENKENSEERCKIRCSRWRSRSPGPPHRFSDSDRTGPAPWATPGSRLTAV